MAYVNITQPLGNIGSPVANPLEKQKMVDITPEYEAIAAPYRSYLMQRLAAAKEARDTKHAEFNNKTYYQYYEENEKIANTYLEEPVDKTEKKLSTGTIESKLNTLLSHLQNLNLTPSVMAYDKNNRSLQELGTAFTDIMLVTAEHDGGDDGGDKEKRLLRQRELLKQGTVFVMEQWLTRYEIKKKLKNRYDGKFAVEYSQSLEKVFEGCSRDILYGPNVYLGDITAFSMNDQPYLFTVEHMSYDLAASVYGQFDNWKFVKPGMPTNSPTETSTSGNGTIYDQKWRLTTLQSSQVEIIKYYDQGRDEFMILVNGILLLPPGFPLSAVTPAGKYNIAKQVLYVINNHFTYGKSFVSSGAIYELSKALDRMLALFELKTLKSVTPAYINTTNKVIPARVLRPGNIAMGIPPNALQAIGNEAQGVNSSEFQIFQELQNEIEKSTISAVFQGQQAKSGATATEVIEVQRQAKLTLGLIIAAATMLEVKLAYLRLHNILGNWLQPYDQMADGTPKYRSTSRKTAIEGDGVGERIVIPVEGELPPPEVIRMLSLSEEIEKGYPVRRMYLSPKIIRESQLRWYIVVEPKEEETSAYHKVLFREMLGDAMTLMQIGAQINVEGVTDKFASVYNIDKAKIFSIQDGGTAELQELAKTASGDRAAGNNMSSVPKAPQTSQKTQVN
jgi:hypothetical protein